MQHSEQIVNEIISLSSLGYSSRKVARIVFGNETQKSTVNSILSRVVAEPIAEFDTPSTPKTILFIPDCQVRPDVDTTYLRAIGEYIVDKKPDIIVNIGDFHEHLEIYRPG